MANTATLDFTVPADPGAGNASYQLSATLILGATANAQGFYTVTGVEPGATMTINGTSYSVTGVSNADGANNNFNPSGTLGGSPPVTDLNGITFVTTDTNADAAGQGVTTADVNFYFNSGGPYYSVDVSSGSPDSASVVAVSNVSVCFASGSRLKTSRGEVAVEDLAIGDLAMTASGEARAIIWIGHKRIERPSRGQWPVRVMAGAFGENRPARDLFLSPGHAVCIDVMGDVFVPVDQLINGDTVAPVEAAEVTYWHVELDSHDVLLAEGLPCESYMDCGNRAWFGREYGRLADVDPERVAASLTNYARPFVDHGPIVEAIRQRLDARSARIALKVSDRAPQAA